MVSGWLGLLRVSEIETRVVANGSSLQLDDFAGKLTFFPAVDCHEYRGIASHP